MDNEKESIKVLVVDDEQDIRTLLNIYLKKLGYEVVEAADGVEAVEAARANSDIDLIVMDIMMPVMNGYNATKRIRSMDREDAKEIPIIAMTANAFEEDKRDAIEAGMNGHVAKPIQVDKLLSMLAEVIRQ